MPLVRIDLRRGRSPSDVQAIADGVHRALVHVVGIPEDDRFQVVTEHEPGSLHYDARYLGVARSDGFVLVQITLVRGRHPSLRQALYARIVAELAAAPGVRPEDVMIVLVENDPVDWSVGNGEAQLLRTRPAQLPVGPVDPA